ncbi:hypothetical protein [Cupriavidus basilensis]|uniref:AbiJ-related protein n=1 Tax=Cupriavidus basilensis TaxID=68895 RepID=UPI0039F71DF8
MVQHYLRHPDYSNEELLIRCGALTCSQTSFFALLEKLLHPVVHRDALAPMAGEVLRRQLLRWRYPEHFLRRPESAEAAVRRPAHCARNGGDVAAYPRIESATG